MRIIDYSNGALPPGEGDPLISSGKFVHLNGPDDEYLVLAPPHLAKYHAHIVARFCREREDVSFVMPPNGETGYFATKGWSVHGGGRFQLDRAAQILRLFGASQAFGAFDADHLLSAIPRIRGWETVRVETNRHV